MIAGILIGTSYIPFQPWALFFGLVPLFIFWMNSKSLFECFVAGWITQFILNLIGFHWIYYLAAEFGHFPGWLAALTLLGFAATAHLYFPLAGLVWFWLNRKFKIERGPSLILMFALFAVLQKYFLVLFPWHFGYEWFYGGLKGFQLADIIGFEGLNVIAIFANILFAAAYFARFDSIKTFWTLALSPIAMIFAINLLGLIHSKYLFEPDAHVKVLAIQGNIGNTEKIQAERGRAFQDFITNQFIVQTDEALRRNPDTEIVVWPETAFADHLDNTFQNEPRNHLMRDFVARNKISLFTGAYHEDTKQRLIYNSLFLIDRDGAVKQPPYDKKILLAFGEYVPFSKYFPKLLKWLDMAEFGRGVGSHLLLANGIKFGPQICYEGLYSSIARELSQIGSEIFINVTNDSWYGTTFEPFQHLYMTAGRAIEFRRPLIRTTNTGITTVVLPNGEFLEKSPTSVSWSKMYDVPFKKNPEHTIYEKIFYIWDVLLGLTIMYILVSALRGRKRARV